MFDPVDRETMENAVTIGRYVLEHAKAAYSLMGADAVNKNARYPVSYTHLDVYKRQVLRLQYTPWYVLYGGQQCDCHR